MTLQNIQLATWQINACLLLAIACLLGCGGSGGKSVLVAKDLVPEEVAKRAMELYDADSDGKIDAQELKKCLALENVVKRIDANNDGAVAAGEIAARFNAYQSQSDLLPLSVHLERGKRPLASAEVVFEPAPFMGENLPSFKGVSDDSGKVSPTCRPDLGPQRRGVGFEPMEQTRERIMGRSQRTERLRTRRLRRRHAPRRTDQELKVAFVCRARSVHAQKPHAGK